MQARCRRAVGCTLPGICDLQMQPTALQFRAIIFKAKYTFCAAEIQRYYTSRCAPLCASIYYAWILRWYGWIDREIFFTYETLRSFARKSWQNERFGNCTRLPPYEIQNGFTNPFLSKFSFASVLRLLLNTIILVQRLKKLGDLRNC